MYEKEIQDTDSALRAIGLAPTGEVSFLGHYDMDRTSRKQGVRVRFEVKVNKELLPGVLDILEKLLPHATIKRHGGIIDALWYEPKPLRPERVTPVVVRRKYPKYPTVKLTSIEGLKVNLGAGEEVIRGWKSFDLPPERNVTYDNVTITPDFVGELPHLPFADNSVAAFRTRDLLMTYNAEGYSMSELGREVYRCLKPGGKLVTIENPGFERAFGRWLRITSISLGRRVPYLPKRRFRVTTYVKQ